MRFTTRKHRGPPSVIIVSLIDVLIVVLIFMMVATTFKQQPAMRLALPESKQTNRVGESMDHLVVTINRQEPYLFLGARAVTLDKLKSELQASATRNSKVSLSIRADKDAPFGQIVRVMDAAKDAGIRSVNAFTRAPGSGGP
jgi:biopolymer transport protein ExbD